MLDNCLPVQAKWPALRIQVKGSDTQWL